jgi:hypothetical protein
MKRAAWLGCAWFLAACASGRSREAFRGQVGPLVFEVKEQVSGDKRLDIEGSAEVDRSSMIRVDFGLTKTNPAPADPRWQALNDWLHALDGLVAARGELEARASGELEAAEVQPLIDEIGAFDDRVDELAASGEELLQRTPEGRRQAEAWESERNNAAPGAPPQESELTLLGRYFAREIEHLADELDRDLSHDGAAFVLVSAFAHHGGGDAVRLHVRNYDEIEGKDPAPKERLGLDLSTAERERLGSDLAQAKRAAEVLRSLDARMDELVKEGRDLARQLGDELQRIGEEITSKKGWADLVPILENATREGLSAKQLRALDALLALARSVQAGVQSVQKIEELARRGVRLDLDLAGALAQLLDENSELRKLASEAVTELGGLLPKLKETGKAAEESARAFEGLDPAALIDLVLAAAAPEERQRAKDLVAQVKTWLDTLRPLVDVARTAAEFLGAELRELAAAASAVSAGDGISAPRSIDDLEPGLVELGENVEAGDRVRVVVQVFRANAGKPGDEFDREELDFRVTRFGWRRTVRGEAMLVRGISGGTNSSFEPNVTAMATWYHKQRDPSDFGAFWNWLDPGLGIHAASMNLDPAQSVEFGLGAQLSFWDGYLFAGIGYDLSVSEDRGYFFVGTSLFKLLGALSN